MLNALEKASEQTPLFTWARYCQVPTDNGVSLKVNKVLVISAHSPEPNLFCHLATVPVFPPRVRVSVELP